MRVLLKNEKNFISSFLKHSNKMYLEIFRLMINNKLFSLKTKNRNNVGMCTGVLFIEVIFWKNVNFAVNTGKNIINKR